MTRRHAPRLALPARTVRSRRRSSGRRSRRGVRATPVRRLVLVAGAGRDRHRVIQPTCRNPAAATRRSSAGGRSGTLAHDSSSDSPREPECEPSFRGRRPRASRTGVSYYRCHARRMVGTSCVRSRGRIDRHHADRDAREVANGCREESAAFYPRSLTTGRSMRIATRVGILFLLATTARLAPAGPDAGDALRGFLPRGAGRERRDCRPAHAPGAAWRSPHRLGCRHE
jgi:hypothetical protein